MIHEPDFDVLGLEELRGEDCGDPDEMVDLGIAGLCRTKLFLASLTTGLTNPWLRTTPSVSNSKLSSDFLLVKALRILIADPLSSQSSSLTDSLHVTMVAAWLHSDMPDVLSNVSPFRGDDAMCCLAVWPVGICVRNQIDRSIQIIEIQPPVTKGLVFKTREHRSRFLFVPG
jgi:hypothetical protein